MMRYMAVTLRSKREGPVLLVGVEDGAVLDEAGAVEEHVDVAEPRGAARRSPSRSSTSRRSVVEAARSAARRAARALMSVARTRAPSAAMASAVARPIPCPAAVTRQRLPFSRSITSPVRPPAFLRFCPTLPRRMSTARPPPRARGALSVRGRDAGARRRGFPRGSRRRSCPSARGRARPRAPCCRA